MTARDWGHWFGTALILVVLSAFLGGLIDGLLGRPSTYDSQATIAMALSIASLSTIVRAIRETRP